MDYNILPGKSSVSAKARRSRKAAWASWATMGILAALAGLMALAPVESTPGSTASAPSLAEPTVEPVVSRGVEEILQAVATAEPSAAARAPEMGLRSGARAASENPTRVTQLTPQAEVLSRGGRETLRFTGSGGDIIIDLQAARISEQGMSSLACGKMDAVEVDAGHGRVTVLGTSGDDEMRFAVHGRAAGSLSCVGHAMRWRFTNLSDGYDGTTPMSISTGSGDDLLTLDIAGLTDDGGWLTFDGGLDSDTLQVAGAVSSPLYSASYTPGPGNAEGQLLYARAETAADFIVDFAGLEPVLDSVPGTVTINATNADNAVTYSQGTPSSYGKVAVDGFETYEFTNKTSITLNGLGGNDTVILNNSATPAGLTLITVNGGDGMDFVDAAGEATVAVVLNGNGADDTLVGGGSTHTLNGNDGDDTLVEGSGTSTNDGGAGFDTVVVEGTPLADAIEVTQDTATSFSVDVNGSAQTNTISNVEALHVEAGEGDDFITIEFDDLLAPADVLPITVLGGPPSASDQLIVIDDGLGDVILLREGADGDSGTVTIAPGNSGGPTGVIVYDEIEDMVVSPMDATGGTGADSLGRFIVFKHDPYENNDVQAHATFLGSAPHITLDPAIDPTGDEDWFEVIPGASGLMDIWVDFTHVGTLANGRPGLPMNGDVDLGVHDAFGNLIVGSYSITDDEQVVIPVVSGESYYIRVYGFSTAINGYSLDIRNEAAPVPTSVLLDPISDTGGSNGDGTTGDSTPRVTVQADLSGFAAQGISILTPAQYAAQTPGVAVQVVITDLTTGAVVATGIATPLPGSTTEFEFTPAAALPDGNYAISARVMVQDGRMDGGGAPAPATGHTTLSVPLPITTDSQAPTGSIPDLLASSDSGADDTDNVTNVNPPAFSGTGETNALVRLYANDVIVGAGFVTTSGSWEVTIEPLDDGIHQIRAEYEDLAGNVGGSLIVLPIEIDTEPPNTPYLDLVAEDDTGDQDDDNVTDVATPRLVSTINDPPGPDGHLIADNILYRVFDRFDSQPETILVDVTTLGANGAFTDTVDLRILPETEGTENDGVHNLKLEAEDRAGNYSPDFLLDIVLDRDCEGLFPGDGSMLEYGPVPAAPFVVASDGKYQGRVRVTWSAVEDASAYLVYRAERSDLSDAALQASVTELFFDDYSARFAHTNGCNKQLVATLYYYQIRAVGKCIPTEAIGSDAGYAGIHEPVCQYVLPAAVNLQGRQQIADTDTLSVRLCSAEGAIDATTVWVVMYAQTTLSGANIGTAATAKCGCDDLWVTYTPDALWLPGEIIRMTVGAMTTGGDAVGPVTFAFEVDSTKNLIWDALIAQPPSDAGLAVAYARGEIPVLAGGTGEVYTLLPETPYATPQTAWIPAPAGVDPEEVAVHYLCHDGENKVWVPGSSIYHWLAPDGVQVMTWDGVTYLGVAVTHAGTVQLGPVPLAPATIAEARVIPVAASGRAIPLDLLLLAAIALGLWVGRVRRRRWEA